MKKRNRGHLLALPAPHEVRVFSSTGDADAQRISDMLSDGPKSIIVHGELSIGKTTLSHVLAEGSTIVEDGHGST